MPFCEGGAGQNGKLVTMTSTMAVL